LRPGYLPDEFRRYLLTKSIGFYKRIWVNRPDVGKVIPGSGGLRKLRWSAGGHGKRGGIRVIYYWFVPQDVILLLFPFSKNEQDDLTVDQLRKLRRVVEREYL